MDGTQESRPNESEVVAKFSSVMLGKMVMNQEKGHWAQLTPSQVLSNIRQQLHETEQAVQDLEAKNGKATLETVLSKCANGSNYFMILADNVGSLKKIGEG